MGFSTHTGFFNPYCMSYVNVFLCCCCTCSSYESLALFTPLCWAVLGWAVCVCVRARDLQRNDSQTTSNTFPLLQRLPKRRCSGSLGIGNISKTFPIRFDCDSSEKEKQSEERAARELFLEEPNRKSVSACQRASVQSRFELY